MHKNPIDPPNRVRIRAKELEVAGEGIYSKILDTSNLLDDNPVWSDDRSKKLWKPNLGLPPWKVMVCPGYLIQPMRRPDLSINASGMKI